MPGSKRLERGAARSPQCDFNAEYLVGVDWLETLPLSAAIWEKGMFANQNSACKLRNKFTLDVLYDRFGIEKDANA